MPDDLTMPVIAICGGFTLLFVLACILIVRARRIARRRRALLDVRRTSFHLAVIVPDAANCGRAAFENIPLAPAVHAVRDDQLVEVVDIQLPPPPAPPPVMPVSDYTTVGYAPRPPAPPPPRPDMRVRMHYLGRDQPRMARGSTPAISSAPQAHTIHMPPERMPARPAEWDVPTAPSVTARMRAYRR